MVVVNGTDKVCISVDFFFNHIVMAAHLHHLKRCCGCSLVCLDNVIQMSTHGIDFYGDLNIFK